MISRNQIKHITSLKHKKFRDENNSFIVEGDKMVRELVDSEFKIELIFATKEWINTCDFNTITKKSGEIIEVSNKELERISLLKTPNKVLAVAKKHASSYNINDISKQLTIVLENIQDPGNLGTILRTADWFGIKSVFCSSGSADIFNHKTVQASMGAIFRINVHYVDLTNFVYLLSKKNTISVFGTFLDGNNIYKQNLPDKGMIVFGNESKGISVELSKLIENKLNIPSFSPEAESLNIASAVAIVCSEFKRNI